MISTNDRFCTGLALLCVLYVLTTLSTQRKGNMGVRVGAGSPCKNNN